MTVFIDPAEAEFCKRWKLKPGDPGPVIMHSPTFPEDHARNLEARQGAKSKMALRTAPAREASARPANVRFEAPRSVSRPSQGAPSGGGGKFVCAGGNLGLAAGGCYGEGEPYLYSGLAWPPGVDITTGNAPGGVEGYLKGWSASANGLPGGGISFADGKPTANAWTIGTPGISATYGMSLSDIAERFRDAAADASKGIYNMAGRPYDDRRDRKAR